MKELRNRSIARASHKADMKFPPYTSTDFVELLQLSGNKMGLTKNEGGKLFSSRLPGI